MGASAERSSKRSSIVKCAATAAAAAAVQWGPPILSVKPGESGFALLEDLPQGAFRDLEARPPTPVKGLTRVPSRTRTPQEKEQAALRPVFPGSGRSEHAERLALLSFLSNVQRARTAVRESQGVSRWKDAWR